MSAWILTQEHIQFLVRGLLDVDLIKISDASFVGRILAEENYRSVNFRYNEDAEAPDFEYLDPLPDVPRGALPAPWIIKAVGCYDYQTCEHGDYATSLARLHVMALRGLVREQADDGGAADYRAAYHAEGREAPPWGIERGDLQNLNRHFKEKAEQA